MKVLHLIRSLKKAGAEKICVDICTELNRREESSSAITRFYES